MSKNSQVIEEFGYTQIKVEKFKYTWIINNFNYFHAELDEILVSPTFPTDSTDGLNWRLEFYPGGKQNLNVMHLYLRLISNVNKKVVKVSAKIFILNEKDSILEEYNLKGVLAGKSNTHALGFSTSLKAKNEFNNPNYISDQKISIICEIGTTLESKSFSNNIAIPEPILTDTVKLLFENAEFSDITLSADGTDFKVHKAILAIQSPVFKAMFLTNMKENCNHRVEITDVDEETLREMLRFIYTGKVLNLKETAQNLLKAADKYLLQGLKVMCENELSKHLSITDAPSIFTIADMYGANQLKDRAKKFIRLHIQDVANTNEWEAMLQEHPNFFEEIFTNE